MILHSRAILFCGGIDSSNTWYDLYYKKGIDTAGEENEKEEKEFFSEEEFKV